MRQWTRRPPRPSRPPSSSPDRLDRWLALGLGLAAAALAFSGLGAPKAPRTFYTPSRAGETLVADLGKPAAVGRVCAYVGLGEGAFTVELAASGRDGRPGLWQVAMHIAQPDPFGYVEWRAADAAGGLSARWLRLRAERPGLMLGEIGLFEPGGRPLPPPARAPGLEALFDEPGTVPFRPGPRTGMYFDETYFARSGWEMLLGRPISERTHPPLGKALIAGGMRLFGVTPFGWRFAGALAGALAVSLLYLLARRLIVRREPALAAALLFLLDFMRFAQARLATVDVFVLLLTLLAFYWAHGFWTLDLFQPVEGRKAILCLVAAGAAVGAAASCKWSGAYAAAGAALLWTASAWRHAGLYLRARHSPARGQAGRALVLGFPMVALRLLGGLAGLVVVPVAVYLASYLPAILWHGATLADIVAGQARMFHYHRLITETRWYASPWWEWPLLVRPIWLYRGLVDVPAGSVSSIVTMGNPALWWGGGLALLATAGLAARRSARSLLGGGGPAGRGFFILAGFLSQYLPWVLAPRRLTFIYHYLPCVPFLALASGYVFDRWLGRAAAPPNPARTGSLPVPLLVMWAFVGLAALLFVLYFPLLTGLAVPRGYAGALRWLKTWVFFQ